MSTKSHAAGVATLVAILTVFTQVGQADAVATDRGLSRDLRVCLRPIHTPRHSADVVQGWIDGCRAVSGPESQGSR